MSSFFLMYSSFLLVYYLFACLLLEKDVSTDNFAHVLCCLLKISGFVVVVIFFCFILPSVCLDLV